MRIAMHVDVAKECLYHCVCVRVSGTLFMGGVLAGGQLLVHGDWRGHFVPEAMAPGWVPQLHFSQPRNAQLAPGKKKSCIQIKTF